MPMVLRKKGWMYLGMMQNTWTTENQRLSVRGQRDAACLSYFQRPRSHSALSTFLLFLLASKPLPQNFSASPYDPTFPHWFLIVFPLPYAGPASLLATYLSPPIGPLGPPSQLTPTFAGPQSCQRAPGSLTTGKSTEPQFERHEHVTQVVGLWYDLHAAVLGIIEDPCTLQVRVAQLRVAHVSDMQKPVPHIAQGPGWGQLRSWYPGLETCSIFPRG